MNQDERTTVAELRRLMEQFVSERDWHQFHAPKNLTMALTIEAGELMEHFQWLTVDESRQVCADSATCNAVGEEIADVCCYLLALVNAMDLDLATLVRDKMLKNATKYPAPNRGTSS